MKICILSRDFYPNIGGIASHVYEISKEFVKQGNNVHIITFKNKIFDNKYEELEGIKVHRIYLPNIRIIGRILYSFFEFIKLLSLIKYENINIIHSHTTIPDDIVTIFIKNRCKIITEHSSRFLLHIENNRRIKLYKTILNHADYITGPSKQLTDVFIKLGINKNKILFISNGVDINKFNPFIKGDDIKHKYNIPFNHTIILCPTRLAPVKGTIYLIKSIPIVLTYYKNIKILIVGDGEELIKLKKLVNKLKLSENIIFTRNIDNIEMPKYYAISDIVVLPSLREATSIAGLEAMASGKALIGTKVGGIPYIIENNNTGLLIPPRNPKKIAEAIIELINNHEKRYRMGINARKRVEKYFSWNIIAKKFLCVYKKAYLNKYVKLCT